MQQHPNLRKKEKKNTKPNSDTTEVKNPFSFSKNPFFPSAVYVCLHVHRNIKQNNKQTRNSPEINHEDTNIQINKACSKNQNRRSRAKTKTTQRNKKKKKKKNKNPIQVLSL
jgi:hypothetical protein